MTNQPFLSYLHLYAAITKKQITDLIKNKCIDEELVNINEIYESWQHATESLRQIEKQDSGAADNCKTFDLSSDYT